MPPSEQTIQRAILRKLRERGYWTIKVIAANRNGCPDILACHQGKFIAIEVKRPGGRLSPIQRVQLRRIREAGGIAIVAQSWAEVDQKLSNFI